MVKGGSMFIGFFFTAEDETRHFTFARASRVNNVGVVFATEKKRHDLGQNGCCLFHCLLVL